MQFSTFNSAFPSKHNFVVKCKKSMIFSLKFFVVDWMWTAFPLWSNFILTAGAVVFFNFVWTPHVIILIDFSSPLPKQIPMTSSLIAINVKKNLRLTMRLKRAGTVCEALENWLNWLTLRVCVRSVVRHKMKVFLLLSSAVRRKARLVDFSPLATSQWSQNTNLETTSKRK